MSDTETMIDDEQARVDKAPAIPGLGHNGADSRLRSFIERVERLEAEKAELAEDIKEVFGEAKANGYDPKIMRKIVRMRKMDKDKRLEEESLLEVYCRAIGME